MALPAGSNQIRDPEGQNRVVTKCFVKKGKKKRLKRVSFATNQNQIPKRFEIILEE